MAKNTVQYGYKRYRIRQPISKFELQKGLLLPPISPHLVLRFIHPPTVISQEKKYTIALDVDGFLMSKVSSFEWRDLLQKDKLLALFHQRGLLLHAVVPHIIHPGAPEFVKLLMQRSDVDLVFYSSAVPEINEIRIRKFLIKVLGENDYFKRYLSTPRVFSRQHLHKSEQIQSEETEFNSNLSMYGSMKKDLRNVTNDLANTGIVDDDESYIIKSQLPCLLKVNRADNNGFIKTLEYFERQKLNKIGKGDSRYAINVVSTNNVFYAAGLLLEALEIANKTNCSLSSALISLQYVWNKETNIYDFLADGLNGGERVWYDKGLRALHPLNPNLSLNEDNHFLGYSSPQQIASIEPIDINKVDAEHQADLQDALIILCMDICAEGSLSVKRLCKMLSKFDSIDSFLSDLYWDSKLPDPSRARANNVRDIQDYGLNQITILELIQLLSTLAAFAENQQSSVFDSSPKAEEALTIPQKPQTYTINSNPPEQEDKIEENLKQLVTAINYYVNKLQKTAAPPEGYDSLARRFNFTGGAKLNVPQLHELWTKITTEFYSNKKAFMSKLIF